MPDPVKAVDPSVNAALARVLRAQERVVQADKRVAEARKARDQAIREASRIGLTRRSLARATGLTPGRVQQIVDKQSQRRS